MKINPLNKAIGVKPPQPLLFTNDYARAAYNRKTQLSNTFMLKNILISNKPIGKNEVKLLLSFSVKLIHKLKHKDLRVKDLELWFTTLQHSFYLEQIMPDVNFANIKKIIMDVTEHQFMPHLKINEYGNFKPDINNAEILIKLHHTHSKLIILFQENFIHELCEELLVRRINDGRGRYAQILDEGMKNYRLFMTLQPEIWRKLVDLDDFKEVNSIFKAHKDLQSERGKF